MREILLLVSAFFLSAQHGTAQEDTFDFAISLDYLKFLVQGKTILPTLKVKPFARTKTVHTLANDCEMHVASTPTNQLGDPGDVVVEPPNLCKFQATGAKSWGAVFDSKVINQDCEVVGFPRIFTEHAQGAGEAANPNHVLEIHPALSMNCGSKLSFAKFLKYFDGMRTIKPSTAASCISSRNLEMRLADEQMEFREDGGQCGNFAVVEVGMLNRKWIRDTGGGHSATARVSADGTSRTTLKLYTLEGTEADDWLTKAMTAGVGSGRVFVHGLITYDYIAINKVFETLDVSDSKWHPVPFPLALVVFGFPQTAPWEEQ